MKTFMALLWARNKEFYRDKGSLTWAVILPVIIIIAIALAFSREGQELFKIGVLIESEGASFVVPPSIDKPYITVVGVVAREKGLMRVRHHQFDLLLESQEGHWHYWINPHSHRGEVVESLLRQGAPDARREEVTGRPVRYIDWVMPGVLGMNIMFGALFGAGYVIVRYRKMGVLKRLQATPVTAFEFLAAQLCSRLLIIVVISAAIFAACHVFMDFLVLGSPWVLLALAFTGGFAMTALGLIVSSRTDSEELAGGLLNLATYPMLLLSEVWFSLDGAPVWLQQIAQLLPLTHMLDAARAVMLEGAGWADVAMHLWILSIMSIVFLALAAGLFRWGRS